MTLKNALRKGHLAQSFLFCGPRGVGKTTCARILAKAINCEDPSVDMEPCNTCPSCEAFNHNASFNIFELDAASNNSVDDIRSLIDQVRFAPQAGKYKVYIIDEVHMLSTGAFNAFLKTLEEPPSYAIFILATTEKHKIIPTILSRCQIYDFKRIENADIVSQLRTICEKEGVTAEDAALHVIAQKADGGLRDALSLFDKMVSYCGNSLAYADVAENLSILDYDYYFRIIGYMLTEDASEVLLCFDEILKKGFEGEMFMLGLSEHLRNLMVCKDPVTTSLLEVSDDIKPLYHEQSILVSEAFLLNALNIANQCDISYKTTRNKRLLVELSLLKMTYLHSRLQPTAEGEKKN
jgi:DNA polymerase-3 subunit gamma/tau